MSGEEETSELTAEEKAAQERMLAKMRVPVAEIPVTLQLLNRLSVLPTTPARYQGKPMDMMAVALQGRELGIGPMTAINNIILVNGQISMYAKLMAALVFRHHHFYRLDVNEKRAKITCKRWHAESGQLLDAGEFEFTAKDAAKAALSNNDDKEAWAKYPKMMMTNRVLTWAARMVYADCILGVGHDPEEINIVADTVQELETGVIDIEPGGYSDEDLRTVYEQEARQ